MNRSRPLFLIEERASSDLIGNDHSTAVQTIPSTTIHPHEIDSSPPKPLPEQSTQEPQPQSHPRILLSSLLISPAALPLPPKPSLPLPPVSSSANNRTRGMSMPTPPVLHPSNPSSTSASDSHLCTYFSLIPILVKSNTSSSSVSTTKPKRWLPKPPVFFKQEKNAAPERNTVKTTSTPSKPEQTPKKPYLPEKPHRPERPSSGLPSEYLVFLFFIHSLLSSIRSFDKKKLNKTETKESTPLLKPSNTPPPNAASSMNPYD